MKRTSSSWRLNMRLMMYPLNQDTTPPNSPEDQNEDLLTDDNDSRISDDEYMNHMPALSSDTEPDSDSDNDDDSFDDDDDDVPWTVNLTSNISRGEPEIPPGCPGMVPEDKDPVDITSAEHQDAIQRAFNEIAEVLEAQEMERAARSQGDTIRTSTPSGT